MLYVQLDANWPDNPKVMDAGMDGRGLHATTLCLAKRLETDGWVNRRLLRKEGATDELIDRLIDLDLLEADGDSVRASGWHRYNPTQAAIDARRGSRAEAGRRGNHAKHRHAGSFEDCEICNPQPQVLAGCEPAGSHSDRKPSPETETEIEPEGAAEPPTGPSLIDLATELVTREHHELGPMLDLAIARSSPQAVRSDLEELTAARRRFAFPSHLRDHLAEIDASRQAAVAAEQQRRTAECQICNGRGGMVENDKREAVRCPCIATSEEAA